MSDATMSFIDHRPQQIANIGNLVVKSDNEELARLCSLLEREDKSERVKIDVHPSEVAVTPTILVTVPDRLRADIHLAMPEIPAPKVAVNVQPVLEVKSKLENGIIMFLLTTDIFIKIWSELWH
jgi:hypothetical protein